MNADRATSSRLPAILLTILLLLLAFRLTCIESLRETIVQKAARLDAEAHPSADVAVAPFIGPAWIMGYAAVAFLLAGSTALLAAARRALKAEHLAQFFLIAAIFAILMISSFHAADRFGAIVGTADLATALLCAWAAALLFDPAILGVRGRNAAVAAIVAILAVTVGKALMQHFVEFPDMAQYVHEHIEEALRRAGISDDPVQRSLFLGRLKSAEVSGFGALSNVFATQMIALLALGVAIATAAIPRLAGIHSAPQPPVKPAGRHGAKDHLGYTAPAARPAGQIPIEGVALAGVCVVLLAALSALVMTQSKGGAACGALALVAVILGAVFRRWIVGHRRALLIGGALAVVLGVAAVVGYGIARHGLPTKSLRFRWQYWTATTPLIEQSPALGVGLNNFGDYYLRYKNPASPEDVKDPHNFFIRLAAEAGIPAMLLITALLAWLLFGALRPAAPVPDQEIKNHTSRIANAPLLLLAAALAIAWIPLHLLAEGDDAFTLSMTVIYAIVGWSIFAAAYLLLELMASAPATGEAPLSPRFIALAGVAAALFMLLYDQVNMALVTGPVAMLFWLLLALGGAFVPAQKAARRIPALAAGTLQIAAGIALAAIVVIAAAGGSLPYDPAPYETAYVRAIAEAHDDAGGLAALNQAIALSPNSGELLMQRIALKRDHLHQPVADDIRQMLALDRANARVRLDLALPDSDLPAPERIAALQDALRFDQSLATDEPKRLTQDQIAQVNQTIARLAALTTPAAPAGL